MKRAVVLSMAVVCAAVFIFLGAGTVKAQMSPDQPDNPWATQYKAGETMVSEAEKTIQRCNEQIAAAEKMKKQAQEGRAKAQAAGGTKADQPPYPWLSMEQAADQMIADARKTIERCELQLKKGTKMRDEAGEQLRKMGVSGPWGR
ncbi:MAG: hypothetical protein H6Q52_150 [Deltaproteobacteria bacterium]|nr:hypothetical protein [Deltaproteobacteria bacterium]